MGSVATTNYFFTLPIIPEASGESKTTPQGPDGWIKILKENQTSNGFDVAEWKRFKDSRKVLMGFAEKGQLTQDQRMDILAVLSKGQLNIYENDPKFRGFPVCPKRFILNSPELWDLLVNPERYPEEDLVIKKLSEDAYGIIIQIFSEAAGKEKMGDIPIEYLAEITYASTRLNIPELEKLFKDSLYGRIDEIIASRFELSVWMVYYLAVIWPPDKEAEFLMLQDLSDSTLEDGPMERYPRSYFLEDFHLFNQAIDGGKGYDWDSFPPKRLGLFCYYLQGEMKRVPSLCSLNRKVFERFLKHLKSKEIDADVCDGVEELVENSYDLRERLKKDYLVVVLEGEKPLNVPLWPFLAKCRYIRSIVKDCSPKAKPKIYLTGAVAKGFDHLYHWVKDYRIPAFELTFDQLLNLLYAAEFFKVEEFEGKQARIAKALIEKCDDTPGDVQALAELVSRIDCPELEEYVASRLKVSSQ